nr:uncharacterized protein LOC121470248 [Taeniopygia guttata]
MGQGALRVPKLTWMEEEEGSPAAAPAQETEEVVPFHPPQEGEWQSQAAGLVPSASLAPSHPIPSHPVLSHPLGMCPWTGGKRAWADTPQWPCSIPWGILGLSLPGERRAGLCSPASPAAPQLWLRSFFARGSPGPHRREETRPWPLLQNPDGACSHPHLGWACCHCSAQQHIWSTPWLLALLLQLVCKFIKRIWREETSTMSPGLRAYSEVLGHETSASLLDLLVQRGVSRAEQVPTMVRYIHQWLMANDSAEHRLDNALLYLTEPQPNDAVMTLLRVAPSCDRYGAHPPRGLRAHSNPSPCTACARYLTNREFQGPLAAPFPSPGMSAPSLLPCSIVAPQGPVPTGLGCLAAAGEGQWAKAEPAVNPGF